MSTEAWIIAGIWAITLVVMIVAVNRAEHRYRMERDRMVMAWNEWHKERQQLLDRIQAPSFAEYKQAEVKVIKAQNGVNEPPPLEPL